MSIYECRGCGRLMRRHTNELSRAICGNRVEMPSCCGEEMVRIGF